MMRVHTSAEHWVRALSAPHPREADFRVGRTSKALTLPLRYPLFHVHAAFQFIPLFPLTWAGFSFGVPRPHPSLAKRGVLPSRPFQGFSQTVLDESRGRITLPPLPNYCKAWLQTPRHKHKLDDTLQHLTHTHTHNDQHFYSMLTGYYRINANIQLLYSYTATEGKSARPTVRITIWRSRGEQQLWTNSKSIAVINATQTAQ